MGWPQYVALCWIVLTTVVGINRSIRLSQTAGVCTVAVLLELLQVVCVVLVLSAGGFW